MTAAIDEIAAMRACWGPSRACRGNADCECIPKPAAIAAARVVAAELAVPLRCCPTGDGGVAFECFDDPPSVTFRGFACWLIEAQPDGAIFACDHADGERTWPP